MQLITPDNETLGENLHFDESGLLTIESNQILTDEYLDDLKDAKDNFAFRLNGLTPVASIPEFIVNQWLREGFDFYAAPAKEIIRKLRLEEYDTFIISGDKTF